MEDNERAIKAEKLARDILKLAGNTLLVNLRFLDMALSGFKFAVTENIKRLATDGSLFLFEPFYVLKRYKNEKEAIVHDYLHMLLHCVFRHMYVHSLVDKHCWNTACDIAVENIICELGLNCTKIKRQTVQEQIFREFKEKGIPLTAEKIYRYLLDQQSNPETLAELRGYFFSDDHDIWYMSEEEKKRFLKLDEKNGNKQGNNILAIGVGYTEEEWKSISERLQSELENFVLMQGNAAGGLIQNLKEVNREKYDYTSFLKKFAVRSEAMKINDDEFDYVYYTYGLELYEKMPLVEPLEYKEIKRIREFVIAIDTSGSVAGDLVQTFVQKTYNILKSTESFFSKVNIHIIQCDADIQEHVKISSQEEFDEYMKRMQLHGFGGTDFRPVFRFVDELREQKEFRNLRGLIYFTDGYGTFPEQKPDYESAFVFVNEGGEIPEIPPWAIKLVLDKEDIKENNKL